MAATATVNLGTASSFAVLPQCDHQYRSNHDQRQYRTLSGTAITGFPPGSQSTEFDVRGHAWP